MSRKSKGKVGLTEAEAPEAFPNEFTSKNALMANVLDVMGKMSQGDLTSWMNDALGLIGQEANQVPPGAADRNLQSINSNPVSEELSEILSGETLSEDFKSKAAILFEAAVGQKVSIKVAEVEELYETRLNEEIDEINEAMIEKIDQYLSYVAEQWVKENEVPVHQSIRTELAEDFISGMFKLFSEHYVSIPEEKVDVVEAMSSKISELQEQLNTQIDENINFSRQIQNFEKSEALKEASDGLALTQVDKLKKLSEGVEFSGVDSYKSKLKVIRENYFKKNSGRKSTEEPDVLLEEKNPSIDKLSETISKSVKN